MSLFRFQTKKALKSAGRSRFWVTSKHLVFGCVSRGIQFSRRVAYYALALCTSSLAAPPGEKVQGETVEGDLLSSNTQTQLFSSVLTFQVRCEPGLL